MTEDPTTAHLRQSAVASEAKLTTNGMTSVDDVCVFLASRRVRGEFLKGRPMSSEEKDVPQNTQDLTVFVQNLLQQMVNVLHPRP